MTEDLGVENSELLLYFLEAKKKEHIKRGVTISGETV